MSAPTDPLAFPASAGPTAQKDAPPLSVPTFDVTGKMFVVTGGTQGMGLVISAWYEPCRVLSSHTFGSHVTVRP
ncbi:unnamed protein product [Ectocarpus sp. 12 AP-2014]